MLEVTNATLQSAKIKLKTLIFSDPVTSNGVLLE